MTQGDGNAFLTVKDLARHWRVSRMSIYRAIEAGEIPAITVTIGKIRRTHRISADWVAEHDNPAIG